MMFFVLDRYRKRCTPGHPTADDKCRDGDPKRIQTFAGFQAGYAPEERSANCPKKRVIITSIKYLCSN